MEESEFKNRRDFIKKVGLAGLGVSFLGSSALAGQFINSRLLEDSQGFISLTILHTNDLHSRIDAFPADHKTFGNQGGLLKIGKLVKKIRQEEENVLVLDAGDIFQGTPYFNVFGGEVEFRLMSEIGYDCATMGNHDFDNGLIGFDKMLPFANFPFVTSNYDFNKTLLKGKTKEYHLIEKGGLRIGIFGIGLAFEGLVNKEMIGETVYNDPIETANRIAKMLREEKKCDAVICLSHLGYEYKSDKISDLKLAAQTDHIDLIIGGHTHTFLEKAQSVTNKSGQQVLINQAGWSGLLLGRVDLKFSKNNKKRVDFQGHNLSPKNSV